MLSAKNFLKYIFSYSLLRVSQIPSFSLSTRIFSSKMSRTYTAEWERRKQYLIRSLLQDITSLSPILETNEPPAEPISPTEIAATRSYSPLPDLIIIKEPNRHDEPKEYYVALHKRVLIYYRKLFYDEHFSETSEFGDSNISMLHRNSNTNNKEGRINNNAASERCDNNIIITQAQVHRGRNEEVDISTDYTAEPRVLRGKSDEEQSHNKTANDAFDLDIGNDDKRSESILASNSPSSLNTDNSSTASDRYDNNIIITQAQVHRGRNEEVDISTDYTAEPRVLRGKSDEEKSHNKTANDAFDLDIGNDDKRSESDHLTKAFEDNDGEDARSSTQGHNITVSHALRLNIESGNEQSKNDHLTEDFNDNDGVHARSSTQGHNITASDGSGLNIESGNERSENDHLTEEFEDNYVQTARVSKKEEILRKTHNSLASDASSSPDEPEIMRRRKTGDDSLESMHDLISNVARHYSENSHTEKSAESASCREMEEAKISSPHLSNATATAASSTRKRKIEDDSDWKEIKNRFFMNRSRIFKLCCCRNHVCH